MTSAERIRLIRNALKACGEPVTDEAVARQFRYETGDDPPATASPRS